MHVARNKRTYVAKSGEQRVYESVLVRRTYREAGKVRHETLANLSALPAEAVAAVEATLKGDRLVPAGQAVTITASLPHGHVAAVHAMAVKLGLPALLGPAGRAARPGAGAGHLPGRAPRPRSWPPWPGGRTPRWAPTWASAEASTDDIYAAMDWLARRQDAIEARLAARHLAPAANPARMALFDLSSLVAGRQALPAGGPRLLPRRQERQAADRVRAAHRPAGRPVAVRVLRGTPATRPRSPRSSRWCGTSSGWPRWSWSATGA